MLLAHADKDCAKKRAAVRRHRCRPAARGAVAGRVARRAARSSGARTTCSSRTWSNSGDVDAALAAADVVVEGEYETGAQEQLYIEPQGMMLDGRRGGRHGVGIDAVPVLRAQGADDAVRAAGWTRCASSRRKRAAGLAARKSTRRMIAAHAALLAWKSGRPVKLIYDRAEDMVATTKRHPSRTRHRTAV